MLSTSPKTATLMMRRSSAGVDGHFLTTAVPVRANFDDIRQHLKHLGPSNPATNPNKTRSTTVKVKPGSGVHVTQPLPHSIVEHATEEMAGEEDDETTSLLKPQTSAKDGIPAPSQTYGSVSPAITVQHAPQTNGVTALRLDQEEQADKSTQTSAHSSLLDLSSGASTVAPAPQQGSPSSSPRQLPTKQQRGSSSGSSTSSIKTDQTLTAKRPYVRSGSITENVVESRGVRKVVLQTSSSSEAEESAATLTLTSPPEQPRLVGRSTFGLFSRDQKDSKDKDTGGKEPTPAPEESTKDLKRAADSAGSQEDDEDDEEEIMSPVGGDEDGAGSTAAEAESAEQQTEAGPSSSTSSAPKPSGGGGGARKKNRRKKRKGGKS